MISFQLALEPGDKTGPGDASSGHFAGCNNTGSFNHSRTLATRPMCGRACYLAGGGGGGLAAQSVERATPGEEVLGFIPAVAARSLLVGSVSVLCYRLRQKSWSPRSVSCVAARKIVRRQSWGPSAI